MAARTVAPKIGNAFVRVCGRQLDRFIEFEFFLNDQDLCVELVMPEAEFDEFCRYYDAKILPPESDGATTAPGSQRTPGLYRAAPKDSQGGGTL